MIFNKEKFISMDEYKNIHKDIEIYKEKDINDDTVLYHYTNADALINIIKNKQIWLSQREFMNDKYEIEYPMKKLYNDGLLKGNFQDLKWESFLKTLFPNWDKQYIFSLSLDKDSLHQWSYYGKNDGYCIGFKKGQLKRMFETKNISFEDGRVIYDGSVHDILINKIIEKCNGNIMLEITDEQKRQLSEFNEENKGLFLILVLSELKDVKYYIKTITGFMKQEVNKCEDEYRFIMDFTPLGTHN